MAEQAQTNHFDVRISQQALLDFVNKMVWLQDEPIADPTCAPIYFVSEKRGKKTLSLRNLAKGRMKFLLGMKIGVNFIISPAGILI